MNQTLEERRAKNAEYQRRYYREHIDKRKTYEQTETRKQYNRERQKRYRITHPEKVKAWTDKWLSKHPEKRGEYQKRSYFKHHEKNKARGRKYGKKYYFENYHVRTYGMSREHFDQMLIAQSGLCKICEQEILRPHIDHNHFTGKIRGILCKPCNQALGFFRDSPQVLRRAAQYLEENQ